MNTLEQIAELERKYLLQTYNRLRVGLLDGKLVCNPTVADQKTSLLNIVVAGSDEAIVMVEAGALEVSEETVVDALAFGHEQIKKIVAAIRELHAQVKPQKLAVTPPAFDEDLAREIEKIFGERLLAMLSTPRNIRSSRASVGFFGGGVQTTRLVVGPSGERIPPELVAFLLAFPHNCFCLGP